MLAQMSPALVLEGKKPRLIDEWQEAPPLWDAVRHKVDQTAEIYSNWLGNAEPQRRFVQWRRQDCKTAYEANVAV